MSLTEIPTQTFLFPPMCQNIFGASPNVEGSVTSGVILAKVTNDQIIPEIGTNILYDVAILQADERGSVKNISYVA